MLNFFHKKQKIFDPTCKIRFTYRFEGTVQNIGFRYEILQRARQYQLTGWARNNEDGSVSCQLQGKEKDIHKCLESLKTIDRIIFTNILSKKIPIQEEFDFYIKY